VLLPCYACSLHWYDRLVPLLSRDHRVIAIDLLGEGGSAKPADGYSMEAEAQDVASALGRLNVQGAVVVGHSLGGAVATSLAQQASQLVDRLVIVDEAPDSSYGSLPFLARLGYVPVLGEALRRMVLDSFVKSTYASAFAPGFDISSGFDNPNQVVDDFRAMTYTSYDDLASAADDFTKSEPLDSRIRTAAVPLLVIFGTEDQIWDDPKAAANAYDTVPGAKISMIKGAGHSPNVEKPDQTAALIERFAAGAGVVSPPPAHSGKPGPTAKQSTGTKSDTCRPPGVKQIRVRASEAGNDHSSPVVVHVASLKPLNCQATFQISVDGKPYDIQGPSNPTRAAGPNNPFATKALRLSPKALKHYQRTPSCTTSRSSYFKLALPQGKHTVRIADCPHGKHAPSTVPATVDVTVH
jgi:pimeloyl-ACP methyl ester carboxylesterase